MGSVGELGCAGLVLSTAQQEGLCGDRPRRICSSSTPPHPQSVLQSTPQETLQLIRTRDVVYPSQLSAGAIDFMKSVLVRPLDLDLDLMKSVLVRPLDLDPRTGSLRSIIRGRNRSCRLLIVSLVDWTLGLASTGLSQGQHW